MGIQRFEWERYGIHSLNTFVDASHEDEYFAQGRVTRTDSTGKSSESCGSRILSHGSNVPNLGTSVRYAYERQDPPKSQLQTNK